jgi:pimeloyl-ACP methyl ester carboxylesterase
MLLLLVLLSVTVGCSTTPVGVRRIPARDVHRALTASALSTGLPSSASTQILHQHDLFELHESDPDAAILALRTAMLANDDRTPLLFALAELEFHRGEQIRRSDARAHFLAAALYAYVYLASSLHSHEMVAVDPRFRVAVDLYNRGLTAGLADDDGEHVDLTPRTLQLPFGQLRLERDEADLLWGGYRMTDFVPVAELEVRGLRNRYRTPGVGAPLAASLEPAEMEEPPPGSGHLSNMIKVPATALVVFGGGSRAIEGGLVEGRLLLHTRDDATEVTLGGRQAPLEYEPTAALAFGLSESRPWEFELRRFLSGDFGNKQNRGVRMFSPYDRERIPVVFVHGTASGPWRWAEMINRLQSDPTTHARYQFWIFQFNSGNPIPFSAGLLREELIDLVAELDPEGNDENLRSMVVVGHSQGGLLAKLCVVDSGDVFWNLVSSAPIDELDLQPETRQALERSLFFEPLPFVKRVVFIATPHEGSFLAERWFSRLASRMVDLPGEVVDATGDLFVADDDRILIRGLDDMPSSLDNMRRGNPFLQALARMKVAPGVEAHSIIAVLHDAEDPALAHDGVVTVESQRREGVESEFIVRSGHSTQHHPITIGEVQRILRSGLQD